VSVELGDRDYDVTIGPDALFLVGEAVSGAIGAARVAVITDETVAPLYGDGVLESLERVGVVAYPIVVAPGERSKSWETAGRVLERLAEVGIDRTDAVVALGGGVVGDLAGFCAATYMRGVAYVQVPTTLLAQVDSSVGGKTAVDLEAGKNLVGSFWQPSGVLADTTALDTLSSLAWADGMAEVVKTAFLAGDPFLSWLEGHVDGLLERDQDLVAEMVGECVRFKARVVGDDEREAGTRESLNLGHTLAHALERLSGYETLTHGVAVARGLRFAAHLGEHLGRVDPAWAERQRSLLDAARIPLPEDDFAVTDVIRAMHADKKARGGVVRFVFSTGPGRVDVVEVDDETLAAALGVWESE
jgi:3-dehydroquinate synthase